MRKLSIILICFLFAGCAGSSNYMKSTEILLAPTANKALVRFMRPSGFASVFNFNIIDGETVIGNSMAKSQFDYLAEPGQHLFSASAENKAFLEANLEAGKTYYVITNVYPGVWRMRVAFEAVTRDSKSWDKVEEYESVLSKSEPDQAALLEWEMLNKDKIRDLVLSHEQVWENEKVHQRLRPEDGR